MTHNNALESNALKSEWKTGFRTLTGLGWGMKTCPVLHVFVLLF